MLSKFLLLHLHAAVLLFGLSGLFGKWLNVEPTMIVFARTFIAALAIALWLLLTSQARSLGNGRSLLMIGFSGVVLALHWGTFFHAIQLSTVAIGLIGFSTFPLFVTFIEPMLTGQRLRAVDILCALLVLVGLFFVAPVLDFANTNTMGLAWAVLSGALFAVLTLVNRTLVTRHPVLPLTLYQQCVAAFCTLPLVLVQAQWPTVADCTVLLLLGTLCTALPHVLFVQSLKAIKAQLASVVAGLEPVYGILFAAILLHEIPSLRTVLGGLIVLIAVVIAIKSQEPDYRDSAGG